jgi:hypothetical protein
MKVRFLEAAHLVVAAAQRSVQLWTPGLRRRRALPTAVDGRATPSQLRHKPTLQTRPKTAATYFLSFTILHTPTTMVQYTLGNVTQTTGSLYGDYLLVLSSTRTSCQPRHRRARVASVTAPGRIIGHRPYNCRVSTLPGYLPACRFGQGLWPQAARWLRFHQRKGPRDHGHRSLALLSPTALRHRTRARRAASCAA